MTDPDGLNALGREFEQHMRLGLAELARLNYDATIFRQMLGEHGAVEATRRDGSGGYGGAASSSSVATSDSLKVATERRRMNVGIKELRDRLSRHLATVREGGTVTITDHGQPIARIVPVGAPTALERLIAEGRVRPATRRKRPSPEPIVVTGSVSDLISDQRR